MDERYAPSTGAAVAVSTTEPLKDGVQEHVAEYEFPEPAASLLMHPGMFLLLARNVINAGRFTDADNVIGIRKTALPEAVTAFITDETFGAKVKTSEPAALFVYFE